MVNKKIKICYIVSVDITLRFILFNQLKFIKREGYDVYSVCSRGKWAKDIEKEGIRVKNIKLKRRISPISDLIALINLFFYFKKEKFDIVHTHTPKAGLIGQLAAKMAGVHVIVNTVHGFYFQKDDLWLKRKFFLLTEKISAKCSNLIFFVNKEDIETATKEKICSPALMKYFGGGINVEKFDPKRFSKKFILEKKKQFKINPNNKVVGIIARLVREKGYLDLFFAFKKVINAFPNTTLLVVGFLEPEKKDTINPAIVKRYKIEKNVIFLGERVDVDEIYPLMDIFVLPSHREGLGVSIIEASAMEKPVVSTNIRGCREVVEDGFTGKLVPVSDSDKLAEAIMFLMDNPKESKKMGKRGRVKAKKEISERAFLERGVFL